MTPAQHKLAKSIRVRMNESGATPQQWDAAISEAIKNMPDGPTNEQIEQIAEKSAAPKKSLLSRIFGRKLEAE